MIIAPRKSPKHAAADDHRCRRILLFLFFFPFLFSPRIELWQAPELQHPPGKPCAHLRWLLLGTDEAGRTQVAFSHSLVSPAFFLPQTVVYFVSPWRAMESARAMHMSIGPVILAHSPFPCRPALARHARSSGLVERHRSFPPFTTVRDDGGDSSSRRGAPSNLRLQSSPHPPGQTREMPGPLSLPPFSPHAPTACLLAS